MQESHKANDGQTETVLTVFGVPVTCCSTDYALREIDRNIHGSRQKQYISITNTESMYHAKRIPSHLEYIKNARFSFCDGIGVVIAAKFEGKKVRRLNGPVLMLECCDYGVKRRWRHFFCGGKEGVAEALSRKLTEKFPGLIISGTFCPPFRQMSECEDRVMVEQINATKPDILWVGLGLLKQERWIAEHIDRLDIPWMIGVGAAFDYHAGTAKWAPKWIRRIGMEWLYRLCFNMDLRLLRRGGYSYIFLHQAIKNALLRKK